MQIRDKQIVVTSLGVAIKKKQKTALVQDLNITYPHHFFCAVFAIA